MVCKYHVLMCAGSKLVGDKKGACHTRQGVELIKKLVMELEERDLASEVIVSATTCYGICDKGPIMVVYPEGTWYGGLTPEAIATIAEEHLEGGQPVKKYQI
ncbi:MAG: (2Fe-2S) ferredoxin domain-containing protein [Deltaproteobacteria bacterium]|jgi:(2Fe-2S) ferredoxin|nr:(2Fe-2S) ferredoxin domain-containing protein [Deltaproteobacteria bacterium]